MECDARQQIAAVAQSLSAVATGDLFGTESGYGAGSGLLESFLERKGAVPQVSSVDTGDEKLFRF